VVLSIPAVIAEVRVVNTVEKAVVPPELAVPETTLSAVLAYVVIFVHPVGAAVC
jgi:hypothetical protein